MNADADPVGDVTPTRLAIFIVPHSSGRCSELPIRGIFVGQWPRRGCIGTRQRYILGMKSVKLRLAVLIGFFLFMSLSTATAQADGCQPTEPDMLGPFYKPDAPVRSSVGEGYLLQGTVRSAPACAPVAGARIEVWLTGPDGAYDDAHRATLFSDAAGAYRFTSNIPQAYFRRPPHIHIKVSAESFHILVTQHYPQPGKTAATFDLVLSPLS